MKILMVLTSHDRLGNTGRKTGFWLEEFAAPYFVFRDAGVELTLASPKGGQPPIDPKSDLPENQTPAMTRFKRDATAQKQLSQTVKLSDMKSGEFDTIFYVGGHGPMWDLADNPDSIALIESFYNSGKPVAAVCHSPAVFHRVMYRGEPLVKGKRVTGFTNGEEAAVNLTHVVPFLVEDELKRIGALYEKAADWAPFAIVDGRIVTGQNPASSTAAAKALMELLAASGKYAGRKERTIMKIVVIGGTGLIGSKLVQTLREHGHEAVAASPGTGVNSVTGEGLRDALTGASVVVDVTNSPSWEDAAVLKFFETSTRNLLANEAAAGVGHHVALSVVGTERLLESGFFRAKFAQENLIKASSIPFSIVRATQFFEFVKSIGDFSTEGNKVLLPPALIQPMAADDVASALGGIAIGSPLNGTVEIAGPERFHLDELIRLDLAVRKDPREVIAGPEGRYYGIKVTENALIPGDAARLGETRFKDWLNQSIQQAPKRAQQTA